jgi:uncharacterized protein GlcG (DUF336 family)
MNISHKTRVAIGLRCIAINIALLLTTQIKAETIILDSPLSLASSMTVLSEAIRTCSEKGYKVAVAVVDADGVIKVEARSDGSPVHSQRFAFRKAYTIVSMGPEFGVEHATDLIKLLSNSAVGLANIASGSTDLLFLPGSVLIKAGNTAIGAIGVSGAPLSSEDEVCAQAGVAKLTSLSNKAS